MDWAGRGGISYNIIELTDLHQIPFHLSRNHHAYRRTIQFHALLWRLFKDDSPQKTCQVIKGLQQPDSPTTLIEGEPGSRPPMTNRSYKSIIQKTFLVYYHLLKQVYRVYLVSVTKKTLDPEGHLQYRGPHT